MSRISSKSLREQQDIRETKRQWHRAYHNNPERKAKDRAYQKEYRTRPGVSDAHRKAQEKYAKSKKGIATRISYWQRLSIITRGLDNNNSITTSLRHSFPRYSYS
ncbi:protein of unknown function [Nitrosotalea devaniterrae]|uniref:Uncharacterized protein n=1 Tax=Nitrosotalea devaniterrae TaxID=1078905 RepID=A0A128A380_9ARCH|nr:protein of unknown function [Candidatus Nitrosotalea devanaterra]